MNGLKNISKLFYLVYVPVFVALIFASFTYADSANKTKLSDDQLVIINGQNIKNDATPIGKSGFYVSSFKNAKGLSAEIQPIQNYKAQLVVNDPFEPQYYLSLLNAEAFWDNTVDSSNIVVAVIDGGYALEHEDLAGRWATNSLEIGETLVEGAEPNCTSRSLPLDKSCNNIDDDGNGYADDWRGWDFANSDNDPQAGTTAPTSSYVAHGTEVVGLVGGIGNNSTGAASINWSSKILPIQILTDDGQATTIELAEGIAYAINQGVEVINLSLGSSGVDLTVEALLSDAKDAGIAVVAAAGNCGGESYVENGCSYEGQMLYPASSQYAISVGATDENDDQVFFSSRGSLLDVTAPGYGEMYTATYAQANETSAYIGEIYGTSFSTPIVSGLVAVLKARWSAATNNDIRSLLVDTAYKPAGMSGQLFTSSYGFGRIRPVEALTMAGNCESIVLNSDSNCDGNVNLLDLSLLASQWQKQYTGRTDNNSSGLVDLLDLSLLASQWGQ